MSYRLNNTGEEVQRVVDEMQSRTPKATEEQDGFLSATELRRLNALEWEEIPNEEIREIWRQAQQSTI